MTDDRTTDGHHRTDMGRRRFLGQGLAGVGAAALAGLGAGSAAAAVPHLRERRFAIRNLHTGEFLKTVYWADGAYVPSAMRDIDHVMRDFRTGDVLTMDTDLIDLLSALRRTLGTGEPFELISGYRSPKTNAMLQKTGGGGVATRSLHLVGMAADIRVPGRRLADVRKAALSLKRGGVGFYPKPDFVHVDTGRVRFW